jgi:hypothetical protein
MHSQQGVRNSQFMRYIQARIVCNSCRFRSLCWMHNSCRLYRCESITIHVGRPAHVSPPIHAYLPGRAIFNNSCTYHSLREASNSCTIYRTCGTNNSCAPLSTCFINNSWTNLGSATRQFMPLLHMVWVVYNSCSFYRACWLGNSWTSLTVRIENNSCACKFNWLVGVRLTP